MQITEHRYTDRRLAMALHDSCGRLIATARARGIGGYLVAGNGLCLLDKKPHPMAPNIHGYVNPCMAHVNTAREARRMLNRLARTGAA